MRPQKISVRNPMMDGYALELTPVFSIQHPLYLPRQTERQKQMDVS